MSTYSGAQPPLVPDYYTLQPRKPASITTLGVFGLIVGAIGAVLGAIGPLAALLSSFRAGTAEPSLFDLTYGGLCLILHAGLIAGAIGCFLLRDWGRLGMLLYATFMPVLVVMNIIYWYSFALPLMDIQMRGAPPGYRQSVNLGIFVGSALWLVLPIFIHAFFHLRRVKAAFAAGPQPPPLPAYAASQPDLAIDEPPSRSLAYERPVAAPDTTDTTMVRILAAFGLASGVLTLISSGLSLWNMALSPSAGLPAYSIGTSSYYRASAGPADSPEMLLAMTAVSAAAGLLLIIATAGCLARRDFRILLIIAAAVIMLAGIPPLTTQALRLAGSSATGTMDPLMTMRRVLAVFIAPAHSILLPLALLLVAARSYRNPHLAAAFRRGR